MRLLRWDDWLLRWYYRLDGHVGIILGRIRIVVASSLASLAPAAIALPSPAAIPLRYPSNRIEGYHVGVGLGYYVGVGLGYHVGVGLAINVRVVSNRPSHHNLNLSRVFSMVVQLHHF